MRAIETRKIQRVGGKGEINLDLRLICATHQNIEKKIEEGLFRADLFYRINVFPIEIPTLSERKDDIPELIEHILSEIETSGSKIPLFEDSAISALKEYIWPGNVRELRNVIERSTIIFSNKKINAKNIRENLLKINLPDFKEEKKIIWDMTSELADITEEKENDDSNEISMPHPNHYKKWFEYLDQIDLRRHLGEVEYILIEGALRKSSGSVTEASKSLKINRTTLIEKMKKYSIPKVGND